MKILITFSLIDATAADYNRAYELLETEYDLLRSVELEDGELAPLPDHTVYGDLPEENLAELLEDISHSVEEEVGMEFDRLFLAKVSDWEIID